MSDFSRYLFGAALPGFHWSDYVYLVCALLLVLTGVVLSFYRRSTKDRLKKSLIDRWESFVFTIGVIGLIWVWLRYELVNVLSMRFVILTIYLLGVVWLIYLVRYTLVDYKKKKLDSYKNEQKKKYY